MARKIIKPECLTPRDIGVLAPMNRHLYFDSRTGTRVNSDSCDHDFYCLRRPLKRQCLDNQ